MDRQIEQKKWPAKRILLLGGSAAVVVFLVVLGFSSREASFAIAANKVTYGDVSYADFQDMVSLQGTVEPLKTIQLDATEGGTVEEIFVEDGQMVEAKQPLLRLSNTALRLDYMNRETQIVEQINNLRSTRITLEQNKRQVQEQLVDITYQVKEKRREMDMNAALFGEGAISKNEFLTIEANLEYLEEKKALLTERLATDEKYRRSQLNRIDASIEMMERNLEAIRMNLENLVIKAPIAGQLNSFDHEIGQTRNPGVNMGRIDVLDAYLVSALVDQYYLNRIKEGQESTVTFGGTPFRVQVTKIFPTVVNSQFEVHLAFENGVMPSNIRRGQNVQLRLELSATKKALIVPRGSFSQTGNGKFVFVLDENNQAHRREVKLGSQNPEYIEIVEGLQEGERIITSSYSAFGDAEVIILTE